MLANTPLGFPRISFVAATDSTNSEAAPHTIKTLKNRKVLSRWDTTSLEKTDYNEREKDEGKYLWNGVCIIQGNKAKIILKEAWLIIGSAEPISKSNLKWSGVLELPLKIDE